MEPPSISLVHEDNRGSIYSISLPDNKELMLLFSKAGVFRGGHSHDCDEAVMVLSGKVRYWKRVIDISFLPAKDADAHHTLHAGEVSFNPAGMIHMGEFLEDTWLIEQKFAEKDSWTQEDYEPYREKVRASWA